MTDLTEKANREEVLAAMYGQEDSSEEKRPQPEQLRLAGKATLIQYSGAQLAVPRIEYVESLERMIVDQKRMIEEQASHMRKLETRLSQMTNIAARRMNALESETKEIKNRRSWEL